MNKNQFDVLARLLALPEHLRDDLYRTHLQGESPATPELAHALEQLRTTDRAIRSAYVTHTPSEFRVVVGHHDTHRKPGSLKLRVGDTVRLVAHSTERWIPVQVTALPVSTKDYYRGEILEQRVVGSKFQVGNGVLFGEDQVVTGSYPHKL